MTPRPRPNDPRKSRSPKTPVRRENREEMYVAATEHGENFLSPASGDCRRQSATSCPRRRSGETGGCALSRRRRGSRRNPLSRTICLSKTPALVNWTRVLRALLCPRKGLSPPDSCVAFDCQRTFFRFATRTPSHAANSRGKEDVMSSQPAPTRTLPDKPSLAQLRKQAKELLKSYRAGNDAAVAEIERFGGELGADRGELGGVGVRPGGDGVRPSSHFK
jgi:hypothetical protein